MVFPRSAMPVLPWFLWIGGATSFVSHLSQGAVRRFVVVAQAEVSSRSERLTNEFQEKWINSGAMSGATVLITSAKHILYRREFGTHCNVDDNSDAERICCAYSMTKVVTSIAVLQLVEKGLLTLDDPVSMHLASFQGGGERQTITLRHCLCHQAGFDYNISLIHPASRLWASFRYWWAYFTNDLRGYVDSYLAKQPLLFPPGTSYNYADGANVAAAIVEQVAGVPFAQVVRDNITTPLGMHDTAFVTTGEQKRRTPITRFDMSPMLSRLGLRLRVPGDINLFPRLVRGDGGLKTTASDWAKLVQMLLSHGKGIDDTVVLAPSSVEELGRSTLPAGASLVAPFAFHAAPAATNGTFGVVAADGAKKVRPANSFPGQVPGMGVNVVMDTTVAGIDPRAKGTCWWMGLASTFFSYHPKEGIGCVVLSQEFTCFSRMDALADVIRAAHDLRCEEKEF